MAAASGETIEAVNTLKQGRVRVEKVDERKPEEKLAGAVFEVKNRETGEKVQMETDESGQAESPFLPIGTIGENGSWIPYHYEVRETMPPDGYQLIPRVYEVLIEDQKECEVLTYDLTVPNETTKIKISKLDFDTGLLCQEQSWQCMKRDFWMVCTLKRVRHWKPGSAMGKHT